MEKFDEQIVSFATGLIPINEVLQSSNVELLCEQTALRGNCFQ
jgi:hypothetical protein